MQPHLAIDAIAQQQGLILVKYRMQNKEDALIKVELHSYEKDGIASTHAVFDSREEALAHIESLYRPIEGWSPFPKMTFVLANFPKAFQYSAPCAINGTMLVCHSDFDRLDGWQGIDHERIER